MATAAHEPLTAPPDTGAPNILSALHIHVFIIAYVLDGRGVGFRVPGRVNNSLHIVQTCSGAHAASYKMDTTGFLLGVKRQGREANHLPPTSAEAKKTWIYTSTPRNVFMAKCLIKHRDLYLFLQWDETEYLRGISKCIAQGLNRSL
jgi:hypothetical protein